MTLSELALFIEGSVVATRIPLSPSLLSKPICDQNFQSAMQLILDL
jgi:hypothetical protein